MNNTRKTNFLARLIKYGVALLSVLTLMCVSVGAMLYKGSVKAEGGSILTTDLIAANAESEVVTENGLTVQSNETYKGEIKGVFKMGTNLALDFTWLDETAFYLGNFVIRITDASNAENYFDVVWNNNSYQNKWTEAQLQNAGLKDVYTTSDIRYTTGLTHVQWGDEIRSANPSGNDSSNAKGFASYPYFTRDMSIQKDGTLQLVWEKDASGEDILIVTAAGNSSGISHRVRAIFDGTYDATATDNGYVYDSSAPKSNQWGLPYLDFSNGYTLSFFSSFSSTKTTDKSTDVVFKKLTLGGTAKYSYIQNTNNTKYKTCTLSDGTEYDLTVTELTAPDFYTEYQNKLSVSKQIPLDVVTTGDISTDMTKTYAYDGIVVSAEAGTEYSGEFSARMKGDMSLKFSFPERFTSETNREFIYTVCDNDGKEIFDVVYSSNGGYTTCYVKYGDQYRSYANGSSTSDGWGNHYWYDIYNAEGKLLYYGDKAFFAPNLGAASSSYMYRQGLIGFLEFVWEEDVLSVYANYNKDQTDYMVKIACFDGSDVGFTMPEKRYATEEEFASIGWGLPKLTDLQDGYSLKFYSENKENAPVPVNFIELQLDEYTPVVAFTNENGGAIEGLNAVEVEYKDAYTLPTTLSTLAKDEKLVGWYDQKTGKLYKPGTTLEDVKVNMQFAAYTLAFKMMDGASIRIVTGNTSDSGIRFQTGYSEADYTALTEKGFVKGVGTLLSIENTTTALTYGSEGVVAQISTKEHYAVDDKDFAGYKFYSFAINEISAEDATQVISARGYIAIEYADGVDYMYTDWTVENNLRSVAQVAYACQNATRENEDIPTEYETMGQGRKAVIDYFAAFYGANVNE